jgi:L-fucose isomerase-like protein
MKKMPGVHNMTNHESAASRLWSWPRRVFSILLALLTLLPTASYAVDTLCAKVKIEITQELTMERQGFDAMMKINNGLTTTSLQNVNVNVIFKDEAGNAIRATSDPNDTTAAFFIRIDTMTGIDNVTGTGVVAPATTAEIHWLIIPAPGSGGVVPSGKLYYIGATLDYSIDGKAEKIEVTPDFVYVKPMPLLTLDYFMTRDVWGDDPLTPEVELSEPFTLGVRVKNTGAATATKVKIDSAQPKIVDNRQGLALSTEIIGSYLNDQPAISSLLIPFGDIPASGAANGRWLMKSSLAGYFTDFTVTFTHADSLGGALTSLIKATNPHYLIRDVKVDLPGRDTIRDFLALDGSVLRVYESSGLDTLVTDQSGASVLSASGTAPSGEALFALSTPVTAGPMYVQLPDPHGGTKALGKITRSDGKTIAPENMWLSKKRDANNVMRYYFNLFDADTTGIYNATFTAAVAAARPPVIQLVPDHSVAEGSQLTFNVTATDPDGTAPLLSSSTLPAGATFSTSVGANNVVTGSFSWTPTTGQAGKYPITFSATDGVLKSATSTNVAVTTTVAPGGPDMPLIVAPQVGTSVKVLSPVLEVADSGNALDTAASYHIQVFSDEGMQTVVAEKLSLARVAGGKSAWTLPVSLADNAMYYWRVRTSDGTTYSSWAVGRFFVNTVNDAPTAPAIASPADGTTVASINPVLSVSNSTDPEGDAVTYGFEVFADSLLTQKVAEVSGLVPDVGGSTSWTVTPGLNNTTLYFWRASATDAHGARTVSATGNFLVDTTAPAPGAPGLVAPSAGGVLTVNNVDLTVSNSLRPAGMTLNYFFELGRSPAFDGTDVIRSGAVAEGGSNTMFSVTGLVENAHYFWRVKASDGLTDSPWTYGDFIVDTVNDPPSVPAAINPANSGWVTTTAPMFTLAPSTDPEGDTIAYHIEVYSDAALTNKLVDRLTNNVNWLLDAPLADNAYYYWHVRAEDMRGGKSAWSSTSTFLVRTGSSGSMLPSLAVTSPLAVVDVPAVSTAAPAAMVDIAWEIDDPMSNSRIALYHDSDRLNADGTLIIDGLPQSAGSRQGSYSWDVSALSPGTYYVYAVASNGAGSVTRYAPGSFVVPVQAPHGVVTVTPTTALETTEAGGQATFSVVLGNSPKSDVTIGLSSTLPTEAIVSPQQLLFTTANWKTPQVVTVAGQPDCVSDGDVGYQVITAKAISNDVDYNGIKGADLTLLNRGSTAGCPANNPPVANAGPSQKVEAGSTVSLIGSGTDTDGSIASYAWSQTAGPSVALSNAAKVITSFKAPLLAAETQLTFQLTATDNKGATATAGVNVVVKAAPNLPPSANAGAAQTAISGSTVNLSGSGADSDGTIASYAWTQIAGPQVTLTGANAAHASFVAPTVAASTTVGFSLTVTDNLGATATATVAITVLPNQAPVTNAGTNQTVNENSPVTLTGSGSDADGSVASYSWTQIAGPSVTLTGAGSPTATFTAPAAASDTVLSFRLTVTDNLGASSSATTNVTVKHVNVVPTANAGADQTVNENSPVALAGSGADSDGTIASYSWTQTGGTSVSLSGGSTATASFTAPATMSDTVLSFRLTVTDNSGASSSATTSVTVKHVNVAPAANAGTNQVVNENSQVTLAGSGSDTDGTIASYSWRQTAGPNVTLGNANTANVTFTAPPATADTLLTFTLTVTDDAGASATASTNVTVKHVNLVPTVNAGIAQSANENSVVTLNGSASDSDGTIASYAWVQTSGTPVTLSNANAARASFIAPATLVDTVLGFQLTATDSSGASSNATTSVTVRHVNVAPTANAGANQTVNESMTVVLTGSGTDSDGTISFYNWTQVSGPSVILTGKNSAVASFTAPATMTGEVLGFQLTVTDDKGSASVAASTSVTVKHVNVAPTANAGAAQTVDEQTSVTLSGSGADIDGTIASYAWTQVSGTPVTLTGANNATASFTAPATMTGEVLGFQLTVTDDKGAASVAAATSVTVKHVNVAPTANAGAAQTVDEKTAVTLTGSGSDIDGTIASYSWTQVSGTPVTLSNANAAVASFTAPATMTGEVLSFQLTVTDDKGAASVAAATSVTVKHVNVAPTANAGAAQTVDEKTAVTLTGSGSDIDGTIASYSWTQVSGTPVTLSNANAAVASFTAPATMTGEVLSFQLTVTDDKGAASVAATTNVTVKHVNVAPTANAGAAQTVDEKTAVTLTGSGSDIDGTIAGYSWTQVSGTPVTLSNANAAAASFTAPATMTGEVLSFQLTVTDDKGAASVAATTNVTVKHVNVAPTANAGAVQTVDEQTAVTLTGSGSDIDGTIASYAWTQTAGTPVTLTNANAAAASFTAPATMTGEVLTFQLTVTDDKGLSSTAATTSVTVKHVNVAPTANAGAAQTVDEQTAVTLTGSGADIDGTIAGYSWTQVSGTPVTLSNANAAVASFTAPATMTGEVLSFQLTVTDDKGAASVVATTSVTVKHVNVAPTANAGAAQTVDEQTSVTLSGSGADIDGTIGSYAWTQVSGTPVTLSNANAAAASFTAPTTMTGEVLGFQLTVTDDKGATSVASTTRVTVKHVNVAPTADAGTAQTVDEQTSVTLTGSGSDIDGTIASYAWTQVSGTPVTLTGANNATASFTAPATMTGEVLSFQLAVTDDKGLSSTAATTTVTVKHVNVAPTADAGAAQTVDEQTSVTLSGSGADIDGTIAGYSWTQVSGTPVTLTGANNATASFTAPATMTGEVLGFQLTVTDDKGLSSTAASTSVTVKHVNVAPTANAGADQTVDEQTSVTLTGTGSDIDGTIASYVWTQTAGTPVTLTNANAAVASFTAPATMTGEVLTFQLTVTDDKGLSSTAASTSVTVKHVNVAPTANAGANQTVDEKTAVTLTGSGSDIDGTIAGYSWTQVSGTPVTLTNANAAAATFTAPATMTGEVLGFQLTVTDDKGLSSTAASTSVTVKHVNVAPTANAGTAQTVDEQTSVTLTGTGSDIDGTIASYAWAQVSGTPVTLTGANSAVASFTAPATMTGEVLGFQLTVTDDKGLSSTAASTSVTVKHVNVAPTANAGADQTVDEQTSVTLTGTGSDIDGTIASYVWTQTAGTPVTLTNANAAVASFTAPATMTGEVLTFQLTVTDDKGLSSTAASTNVTVKHVNVAPTANAGSDQTVDEQTSVTLSGSGADIDGTIAGYSWTQVNGTPVTLAGANSATATFTAPATMTGEVLSFQLTVTDDKGLSSTAATTNVTVKHVNVAPTANAGAAQTVDEKTAVTLTGSGSDIDGTIAGYSWTQVSGTPVTLTNANAAAASFTAPATMTGEVLGFQLTVTDDKGAVSTAATTSVTVKHVNVAPTANAGAAQTVDEQTAVTLSGSGADIDGTIASYSWTQVSGTPVTLSNANAAVASFTAPATMTGEVLGFQLTVTDDKGAVSTAASTNVTVKHVNVAPTANAGAVQTVDEQTAVTLTGSGSDIDGTIASYAWTQTAGTPVTLTNANAAAASFTAPATMTGEVLTFQLTVTDDKGATSTTATTSVTVKHVNVAPTANAGADQTVDEQTAVTLTGSGSDIDGTIASYAWTQVSGTPVTLTGANNATASFTAPATMTGEVLSFQLTVTDDKGAASVAATTSVTVKHVNVAPTANAGANQTVDEQTAVTLTGSGADIDGTIAGYSWTQVSGTPVTLTNANAAAASFTAPATMTGEVLTFQLTVTDDKGAASVAATTNVTVRHVNVAPTANAGADQTVDEQTAVTLTGSGSDIDGTIAGYAWTQVSGTPVTLTGANSATASFTAPATMTGEVLTFQLTVTDDKGAASVAATTNVTVKHVDKEDDHRKDEGDRREKDDGERKKDGDHKGNGDRKNGDHRKGEGSRR